jgi:hypothetical protein
MLITPLPPRDGRQFGRSGYASTPACGSVEPTHAAQSISLKLLPTFYGIEAGLL